MSNKIKCTCYEIMQQLEYYNIDKLEQKLKDNNDIVLNYAYVIHHEENNLHFHCMLKLDTQRYITDISKRFDIELQYIEKPKKTGKYQFLYMCQYLIHMNDLTKEQIKPDKVIANFDYIKFIAHTPEKENQVQKNEDFCNDLVRWLNKSMSYYDMCLKYGRDFMKNSKTYKEVAIDLSISMPDEVIKEDLF